MVVISDAREGEIHDDTHAFCLITPVRPIVIYQHTPTDEPLKDAGLSLTACSTSLARSHDTFRIHIYCRH